MAKTYYGYFGLDGSKIFYRAAGAKGDTPTILLLHRFKWKKTG
jgi:hypothetical protein